jgi:hypothetical protein
VLLNEARSEAASVRENLDEVFANPGSGSAGISSCTILLGASEVQLRVVPLPAGLRSRADVDAFLASRLTADLGLTPADWSTGYDFVAGQKHIVACVTRKVTLEQVRAKVRAGGMRIKLITPFSVAFVDALARKRAALEAVVLAEPGAVSTFVDGRGSMSASVLLSQDPQTAVRAELSRSSMLLGGGAAPTVEGFSVDWNSTGPTQRLWPTARPDFLDRVVRVR